MPLPRTGNDVAALVQTAQARGYSYHSTPRKPNWSYKIDHDTRIIYVDGTLEVYDFYDAFEAALAELAGRSDNLTVLPVNRPTRDRRTS